MRYRAPVPGLAIAILRAAAWVNLLFGVGLAFAISLFGLSPLGAKGPNGDFLRIVLELFCAFEGFSGWALLLVVANMAEQLERIQAQLLKQEEEEEG